MAGVKLDNLFRRIDRNHDDKLERDELKTLGKKAEINSGLLGGIKLSGAVSSTLDTFDGDSSGHISAAEFAASAAVLLPAGLDLDLARAKREPDYLRQRVDSYLAGADRDGDGKLDRQELEARIKRALDAQGESMIGLKAEVASKLAVATLDADGDQKLDSDEIATFADDVVRHNSDD